jgi:hypothetical protein
MVDTYFTTPPPPRPPVKKHMIGSLSCMMICVYQKDGWPLWYDGYICLHCCWETNSLPVLPNHYFHIHTVRRLTRSPPPHPLMGPERIG